MLVGLSRVLFLNPSGVGQHQSAEILRPSRAKDPPGETLRHEARQIPHMIEVSVREHNRVYRGRRYREVLPIAQAQLFEALKQTAIEQDSCGPVLQ